MGERVRLELRIDKDRDGHDIESDYRDENIDGVHATGTPTGDAGTLCGMHFVDGLDGIETRLPISCGQCISVLEDTIGYKRRNGKWY